EIVASHHIGSRLGEAGAIALVGARGKLALLGPHHPFEVVLSGLPTMRTVQCGRPLLLALVVEIALFHRIARQTTCPCVTLLQKTNPGIYSRLLRRAQEEKAETVQRHEGGQSGCARRSGRASAHAAPCRLEAREAAQAQADVKRAADRRGIGGPQRRNSRSMKTSVVPPGLNCISHLPTACAAGYTFLSPATRADSVRS